MLDYPPRKRSPIFQIFFEPSIYVMPQLVAFTGTFFWSNQSRWLRDLGPPSVLVYVPRKKGPVFQIFLNQEYLLGPNLCLSAEPFFGRIGRNSSEI